MKHYSQIIISLVVLLCLTVLANFTLIPYLEIVTPFLVFVVLILSYRAEKKVQQGYHTISEDKQAIQEKLEAVKLEHNELAQLHAESQEDLETRVQERTFELNVALQELEEVNRELEQKTTIDDLTGLYNRRFYDQKILAEFRRSRRNLTPLSLAVIDIDHFKKINDNFGHAIGDKCLVSLAKLIKQTLRRSADIGCRYGGEEFCIILPETDQAGAMALSEELRELVADQQIKMDDVLVSFTISCGISTYQQQATVKPIDIFNAADKALYQAKNSGRNQVQNQDIVVLDPEAINEE